jgi:hypothetical protein
LYDGKKTTIPSGTRLQRLERSEPSSSSCKKQPRCKRIGFRLGQPRKERREDGANTYESVVFSVPELELKVFAFRAFGQHERLEVFLWDDTFVDRQT